MVDLVCQERPRLGGEKSELDGIRMRTVQGMWDSPFLAHGEGSACISLHRAILEVQMPYCFFIRVLLLDLAAGSALDL